MKGKSTLEMNQATIVAAVQYYFDQVVFKDGAKQKVKKIEVHSDRGHIGDSFDVEFEDASAPVE